MLLAAPTSRRIWGHFAPLRWQHRTDGRCHEVLVEAEHLADKTSEIVGTLLHEAATPSTSIAESRLYAQSVSQPGVQARSRGARLGGGAASALRLRLYCMTDIALTRYAGSHEAAGRSIDRALRSENSAGREGTRSVPSGERGLGRHLKAVCRVDSLFVFLRNTLTQTTIRCEQCRAFALLPGGA